MATKNTLKKKKATESKKILSPSQISVRLPQSLVVEVDCNSKDIRKILKNVNPGIEFVEVPFDGWEASEKTVIAYLKNDVSKVAMSGWSSIINRGHLDEFICLRGYKEVKKLFDSSIAEHPEFIKSYIARLLAYMEAPNQENEFCLWASQAIFEFMAKEPSLKHIVSGAKRDKWAETHKGDPLLSMHLRVQLANAGVIPSAGYSPKSKSKLLFEEYL